MQDAGCPLLPSLGTQVRAHKQMSGEPPCRGLPASEVQGRKLTPEDGSTDLFPSRSD